MARAQPVEYEIRFDNADHHEAEVRLRMESVPSGTLELRMSRSLFGELSDTRRVAEINHRQSDVS